MARLEHRSVETPDEVREFPYGRLEVVRIGGGEVGRMVLEPGWRWSEHVKPIVRTELCQAPHFQYVVSGRIGVRLENGRELELGPGEVSVIPPGHDMWVAGDEPAVVVDWGGAHIWGRPY